MATMDVKQRPYHVKLPANTSRSPTVPVCTVTPLTSRRRSSIPTSPSESQQDGVRTDRDVRRWKSTKEEKQQDTMRRGGKDQPLKAAIFDLLNYRPVTRAASRCLTNGTCLNIDSSMKYRLMYLVVRAEQQQLHLQDIIATMRSHGSSRHNMRLMIKVKEALLKLHAQMLGIRDNDQAVIQQIGDEADMDEFFRMVESSCSAIEEIPKEVYTEDIDARLGLDAKGVDLDAKHPRVRVKLTRSATMSKDWVTMFKDRPSTERFRVNKYNTIHESRSPVSMETNNNTIGYIGDGRKATKAHGSKLHRSNSIVISPTRKNRLYSVEKYDQGTGAYPCKRDDASFDDDVITAPPTGLVPVSQMPKLQTLTQQHDPKLHSLMREIDGLMDDVGIAGNTRPGLSYEELMWDKGTGNMERNSTRKKEGKKRTPLRSEEECFIQELDTLLAEADK